MDIAAMSIELSANRVMTNVNLAVTKKAMESAEQSAAEILKMLPPSPYSFDVRT